MMASVEIIGEARTVAQYMLSRFEVARRSAFTENISQNIADGRHRALYRNSAFFI